MFNQMRQREPQFPRQQQNHRVDSFMFGSPRVEQPSRKSFNLSNLSRIMQNPKLHKGIDSVTNGLDNVQQVLKVVESTSPIIQEYGTMVKNLPAMFKIMKTLKSTDNLFNDDDTKNSTTSKTVGEESWIEAEAKEIKETTANKDIVDKNISNKENDGISKPKLYI